ncbi:hypothetical protein [Micromonospora sp. AKA38]|uniref:hypothetical protein n=1 Tax=Micromonospora sp. AKA38 TaxID=2733861 RepID=UPI0022CB02AC|nr:hypothetical protein [Micromonospora sp. AKA38]GHJ16147.1 hypothetical protein TPA0908_41420 [Micromonospora sp. AKA38]
MRSALSKVGITVAQLRDTGGSVLADGRAYLVGSLAQGFGNGGSDVDIHVFAESAHPNSAPYLFFVNQVPVDIEFFPAVRVATLVAELGRAAVPTEVGRIALHPAPRGHRKMCLSRWMTAVPLDPAHGALVTSADAAVIRAHLMRHSVELTVLYAALAELVELGGANPAGLWRHSGRALLDLLCTERGLPPMGAKWLPARLRAAGVDDAVRRSFDPVNLDDWVGAVARLVWPIDDPLALVELQECTIGEPVPLGRRAMTVTRYNQLHGGEPPVGGCLRQVVAQAGARRVLAWMRAGLVRPAVDPAALNHSARRAPSDAEPVGEPR